MDFCGENVKAGYWIAVNESKTDNYIKFGFRVKGSSGELKSSVIADFLTHRELSILETERQDYFEKKVKLTSELEQLSKKKWGKDEKK
jgi:hypothetical protein